jgi:hypothetical protein
MDVKLGVSVVVEEPRFKAFGRGQEGCCAGGSGVREWKPASSRNSHMKNAIISASCQSIR